MKKIVPFTGLTLTTFMSVEWMKHWRVTIEVNWKERDSQGSFVGVATRRRLEAAEVESR